MADRSAPRDDQLERALRALGEGLAYPPTPDLAAAVRARLVAGRPARTSPLARLFAAPAARRLALAFIALIALVGAVLIASPAAREAIAGRLGVPGITIEYATPTPTARPGATPATPTITPTPRATPASAGERLGLGRRLTLAEARAAVAFPLLVPTLPTLGEPDEVYLGEPPRGGQVSFVWLPRPGLPAAAETGVGLLVTQFRATIDPLIFKKIVDPNTTVEFVTVGGGNGYWLAGEPHEFFYTDSQGAVQREFTRLAGNVLLWEQGGSTFRIEGARTLDEALRIALSLR